jgi:hypothetical protein
MQGHAPLVHLSREHPAALRFRRHLRAAAAGLRAGQPARVDTLRAETQP